MTKSILRGLNQGMKIGVKEAVEKMDLSCLDDTSKAITYLVNH